MTRSIVPLVMGAWLIIGGILLALGNPTLMRRAFTLLVPLTLIGMGLWSIVREKRLHRLEQQLPSGVLWGELLFALMLLLVYSGVRGMSEFRWQLASLVRVFYPSLDP